jgi:hypothetical protein
MPVFCVAVLLGGCASTGTRVQDSALTGFQKGVTTEADIEKSLGAPQMTTRNADGTRSIMYIYAHAQAKGATFISIVGLFAGGATGQSNTAKFDFDARGMLAGYETSSSASDVRTGIVNGVQTK